MTENDCLINLKAELELRPLNQKVDVLFQEQLITLFEIQAIQMEHLKKIELMLKVKTKN